MFLLLMNGYTIFIAQPLLRFCDNFIIIIQTSMFDFKQSKNNIKNLLWQQSITFEIITYGMEISDRVAQKWRFSMNTTDNLEQFLPILRTASIFSGMSDSEILSVLHCMGAFVSDKEKDSYLLRAGDMTSTMGLLLSGSAIVIQEDVWGHRNIMAQILPGQTFAKNLCRFQRYCIKYQCRSNERLFPAVLRYSPHFRGLPVCLRTSHTFNPRT